MAAKDEIGLLMTCWQWLWLADEKELITFPLATMWKCIAVEKKKIEKLSYDTLEHCGTP